MLAFPSAWLVLGFAAAASSVNEISKKLTCYSCDGRSSNYECNRVAIDRPCMPGQDLCYAEHTMGSQGETLLLKKGCISRSACNETSVGCRRHGGRGWNEPQQSMVICTSCCNQELCNRSPPRNATEAVLRIYSPNTAFTFQPNLMIAVLVLRNVFPVR